MLVDMNPLERPREKFFERGADAVTMEDLLAILLRTGYKGVSVVELARKIVNEFFDKGEMVSNVSPESLMKIKGIGKDKAVTICAAIELGKRLSKMKAKETYSDFSSPKAVAAYVMEDMRYKMTEEFKVALLNTKNKLIEVAKISVGGLSASVAEQRSVFRRAIELNASALILIHNHPSGEATPSQSDIKTTKLFIKAGKVMGIPVLDHIIIGDGYYTSLCEQGYI